MALKVLLAGCSKEERERIEPLVRAVIGKRAATEAWVVSLVKVGRQFSVTLNGPDARLKAVTFASPEEGLRDSILEALRKAGFLGPVPETPAHDRTPGPAGERRDRHACESCGRAFVVIYEAAADEPEQTAAVACPHCWEMNYVAVGKWAADGKDYRAEKGKA